MPPSNLLLDAADTAGDRSPWVPVSDKKDVTLEVVGIVSGDIVQVSGTVRSPPPSTGLQVGDDITADGLYTVTAGPRLLRATLSDDSGGGTVSVFWAFRTES